MIKCELVVDGYSYRVTNDLMNWSDIVMLMKRGDYDGVVRSFTSKFEFVNGAYSLLKKQFKENYLGAAASIVISRRNNSWTWNELFRCTLDFSTYEDSGNVISINAVDDSLASLIKAKSGTQYEYSVAVVREEYSLFYDRLNMMNTFNFTFSDTFMINPIDDNVNLIVSSFNNEVSKGGYIESDTNERGVVANLTDVPDEGIDITLDIDAEYENIGDGAYVTVTLSSVGKTKDITIKKGESKNILFNIHITKSDFDAFQQKKRIYMSIILKSNTGGATYAVFNIKKINRFTAHYVSRSNPESIDVVSPNKLLNRLLQSMNGGNEGLIGEIDSNSNDRLENCMIVAAESIRGIKEAKLYSSFTKFADWMKATFGYVYDISGSKVTFSHRTKYFTDEVVKEVTEFEDFSHSVNPSLIYSTVRIGYDKQDYDSVNGRDEFRFTNTFSTGITLTDNSLDLISPYRSDSYGIEFLVQKRGADTTDTDSDNDVFFISAKLVKSQTIFPGGIPLVSHQYELIRGGDYVLSGVISPETMFNAMYSPRQMLIANKGFIGCCTQRLTYTSGEGNSDVAIGGISEKSDMLISTEERIVTVGEISFSTPEYDIPENQKGLVALARSGERYLGYIQKAGMNAGHEECTKFILSVKRVE